MIESRRSDRRRRAPRARPSGGCGRSSSRPASGSPPFHRSSSSAPSRFIQWGALAAVALRVAHDGWVYDTGSRPRAGVVSALPAIVVGADARAASARALARLRRGRPAGRTRLRRLGCRRLGRVAVRGVSRSRTAGSGTRTRTRFLTHVLGLTADPAFPAMVAFLASGYFALRALADRLRRSTSPRHGRERGREPRSRRARRSSPSRRSAALAVGGAGLTRPPPRPGSPRRSWGSGIAVGNRPASTPLRALRVPRSGGRARHR